MELLLRLAMVILACATGLALLQLVIALFKPPSCRKWLRRRRAR